MGVKNPPRETGLTTSFGVWDFVLFWFFFLLFLLPGLLNGFSVLGGEFSK